MGTFYSINYNPCKTIFVGMEIKPMPEPETAYQSYLSRLWQAQNLGLRIQTIHKEK